MSITNVFKNCWKLSGKVSREQKNNLLSLSLLKSSKLIDLSSVHLNSCLRMAEPKPKTPMTGAQRFVPPGVMTKVLARKAIVKTAKDFAITGSAACPCVKFSYISKAEVESKMKALDEMAFLGIKQLKGIRKLHHMEVWIQNQSRLNFCWIKIITLPGSWWRFREDFHLQGIFKYQNIQL